MTTIEKALQLIFTFKSIKNALDAVDEIEKALEDYGMDSDELQNMDTEFSYWENVRDQINKINIGL